MLSRPVIEAAVTRALAEDLAHGDVTTEAVVSATQRGRARIMAREPLTVCGTQVAAHVFWSVDPDLSIELGAEDGDMVTPPIQVMLISGSVQSILAAERVALNFLQHLSSVATVTSAFCAAIAGTGAAVCDTRKTTPGLRALEKHAVRSGGGRSHRSTLADCTLIKDNHIASAGSIRIAIERARACAPHVARIEVEVETPEQIVDALDAGADVILLDNMPPDQVRSAIAKINGRAITEASGSINIENIRCYAEAGVDLISTSALTSMVRRVDLGLELGID